MKKINFKLKAAIIEKGLTIEQFANEIKMPYYTLCRKINGHSRFTEDEMTRILVNLRKSPTDIFFNDDVAKIATNQSA